MIFSIPVFGALVRPGRAAEALCDRLAPAGAVRVSRVSRLQHSGNSIAIFATRSWSFGIIYAMCYGPEAALFSDLFDTRVRYTGISFVYQFSGIFASGITPIIATYLVEMAAGRGTCAPTSCSRRWSACCRRWRSGGPQRHKATLRPAP